MGSCGHHGIQVGLSLGSLHMTHAITTKASKFEASCYWASDWSYTLLHIRCKRADQGCQYCNPVTE